MSRHLLHDSAIGSVESSYMRLDTWDDVLRDVRGTPMVVLVGAPFASVLGGGAPPADICDNIYLWVFYHGGVLGFLLFVVALPAPLLLRASHASRMLYAGAAVQLLTTGIFTDSLFYFSSVLLFFALGLLLAEGFALAPGRARSGSMPGPMTTREGYATG